MRFALLTLFLFSAQFSFAAPVCPQPSRDCKMNAVANLCSHDSDDYQVYEWASQTAETKKFFFFWFDDCGNDTLTQLAGAVHETTHRHTYTINQYPLVDGSLCSFAACEAISGHMMQPKKIAKYFDKTQDFIDPYITGDAASVKDFCYLIDELNAYGHDLNVSDKLKSVYPAPSDYAVDRRAGVVAMMSFLKTYASVAKQSDAKTWSALQGPLKATVVALWNQGANSLAGSCGMRNWGGVYFYKKVCDESSMAAMRALGAELPLACTTPANCVVD